MCRDERASVLMLLPALVLVLLVLAAITVDFSVAFLGEREVGNAAAAAANDAAAAALDSSRFRDDGAVEVDCQRAREVAQAAFRARTPAWLEAAEVEATSCEGERVRVRAVGRVGYVFAKAIPGAPSVARVEATASATAVRSENY